MSRSQVFSLPAAVLAGAIASGCSAPKVDFSKIQRPEKASQMDAFDVFVGQWDWQAEVVNAEGPDRQWTGQAEWNWTLDGRCLAGSLLARSANASFEAAGVWSWHPARKKYIWWMFNDWGYPQEGTADYNDRSKTWKMCYESVGLDGTKSYGVYEMQVVNRDLLRWSMEEWADALHAIKKIEMTGTYTRR